MSYRLDGISFLNILFPIKNINYFSRNTLPLNWSWTLQGFPSLSSVRYDIWVRLIHYTDKYMGCIIYVLFHFVCPTCNLQQLLSSSYLLLLFTMLIDIHSTLATTNLSLALVSMNARRSIRLYLSCNPQRSYLQCSIKGE